MTTTPPTGSICRGTPKPQGGSSLIPGDAPLFSVIVAAYNRGQHIRPTIASALRQTFRDFELIVVGDGCTDDTLDVVRSLGSPQVTVCDLGRNSGSQSAPNNTGIARSRGELVAYLGHDDVWRPDHLARIAAVFRHARRPDVVASGCVFHGPPGSEICFVTGLLDEEHQPSEHFLPPSALAHTRELIERIGPWPDPQSIAAPVDCEVMLRAVRAGAVFASTGTITVHKFAAGHRYLSYLRPTSVEQEETLAALRVPDRTDGDDFIEAAREQGRYMSIKYLDYAAFAKGHEFERNRSNKGLSRPPLRRLAGKVVLRQTDEPRGLDWYELERSSQPYRWSGPSAKPHILIPYAGTGTARVTLNLLPAPPEALNGLSFELDGRNIPHAIDAVEPPVTKVAVEIPLRADDYSILGLTTRAMFSPHDQTGSGDHRRLGIPVGDLEIEALTR